MEAAVYARLPLRLLLNPDLELLLNKPGHLADKPRLLESLHALCTSGLLTGYRPGLGEVDLLNQDLSRHLEEGRAAPMSDEPTYYALTAAGGAAWETFAAPDWDLFVDEWEVTQDGIETVTVIGASEERVSEYFRCLDSLSVIDRSSIQRQSLDEFEPTYWKRLPGGTRISFTYHERPDFLSGTPNLDTLVRLRRYYVWG